MVGFVQAFPTVESVKIEVEEDGKGVNKYTSKKNYDKNVGHLIDCSNSYCYGGGINMGNLITNMVKENKTSLEETLFCMGQEASAENILLNQKVKLVPDSTNSDNDRYGRLLRYAYLEDGTFGLYPEKWTRS